MGLDWVSFGAGALVATFVLTLARVVRAQSGSSSYSDGGLGPSEAGIAAVVGHSHRPGDALPMATPGGTGPLFRQPDPPGLEPDPALPPATGPLQFLAYMPPEQIAGRLMRENPYVVVYVLAHIDAGLREQVLSLMGEGSRRELDELVANEGPIKISGAAFIEAIGRLRAGVDGSAI